MPKKDKMTLLRLNMTTPQEEAVSALYASDDEHDWNFAEQEGKLAIDVVETAEDMIVLSTLAGADIETLQIAVRNDLLTIRGIREAPFAAEDDVRVHHQECYWGAFSRSVVLPIDVDGTKARAVYRHGVLMVVIPKLVEKASVPIEVIDE